MAHNFIDRLNEFLKNNFSKPSFGAKDLAHLMGMSQSGLLRKLKSQTGKSINQFITAYRLEKAREFLKNDDSSISDIASRSGFSSLSYFTSSFKKQFGYSPSEAETKYIASQDGNAPKHRKKNLAHILKIALSTFFIISVIILIFLVSTGRLVKQNSIAVVPFRDNSQTMESKITCEIVRSMIITSLSRIDVFDIRSNSSSSRFPEDAGLSIPEIGRKLRVRYIIEGSVTQAGDRFEFVLQLIKAKKDDHLIAEEYIFKLDDISSSLLDIAENITYVLNTKLKPEVRTAILLSGPSSNESIKNYLLGNSYFDLSKGINLLKAMPFYREAIRLDSTWPLPYKELSRALGIMFRHFPTEEYSAERMEIIRKLIELRPGAWAESQQLWHYIDLGELDKANKLYRKMKRRYRDKLHHALGLQSRIFGKWKFAEEMLLNAWEEDPGGTQINLALAETYELLRDFPEAIHYLNNVTGFNPTFKLTYFSLVEIILKWRGDIAKARTILEESIKRSPWRGSNTAQAAYLRVKMYLYEDNYDDALEELSKYKKPLIPGRSIRPYFYRPWDFLYARVYEYSGQKELEHAYFDSTRIYIENQLQEYPVRGNYPGVVSCLGMAYAGIGDTAQALDLAEQVKKMLLKTRDDYLGPYAMEDVAWIYTKTGEYKKAIKTIRKLLSRPGPLTAKLLEIDPKWEDLRDQPGFQKLIDKYSIPVVEAPILISGDSGDADESPLPNT